MKKLALSCACAVLLVTALAGCRSTGPMEKTGEAIDEAADDVADVFRD